jgi:ABC-2 type transport system ATP-binding protein
MEILARATDLSRRFGRQTALDGIDLELRRGEILGLLGPNGAGKTTCLRLLSGTLAPSRGRVQILDADLSREPIQAKRLIGYLPERPPLYPELRVDEFLHHCARLRRIPRPEIANAVRRAKVRCGLGTVGGHLIGTLSKGFRQRIGIAQAILHRPRVLILDEPTEGLDPLQIRDVRVLLRELARDCGIILSSHLLAEIQAICDRVLVLHRGRLVREEPVGTAPNTRLWRVRLGGVGATPDLERIPCVEAAIALDPGDRYRVILTAEASSADLARQVMQARMDLLELNPERPDLERLFFTLVGAGGTT